MEKKSLPFCFRYYSRETALRNVFTFVQLHVDPQQKMEDVSFPSPIEFSVGADKTKQDSVQIIRGSPVINYFDVSPTGFAWRQPRPQQIEARRAAMSDRLIFDILLTSGGAIRDADLIYPPTDPQGLRRLLDAIGSSHYDALKKNCLVYFLLKWHQDGREEKFAKVCCIPPQFTMLADAYWHLDSGINVPVSFWLTLS